MNENVWWKCLRWKFVRSVSTSRGRMRVNYACSFKCNITEFNGNLMSKTLSGPGSALTQVWIRQQMCVLSSATAFTYICYTYIYMYIYVCMCAWRHRTIAESSHFWGFLNGKTGICKWVREWVSCLRGQVRVNLSWSCSLPPPPIAPLLPPKLVTMTARMQR